jgi:hypothetical protein
MTIQTTWRHETPAITEAFMFPNGRPDPTLKVEPVVVEKPKRNHAGGPTAKPVTINGTLFSRVTEAAEILDIAPMRIRNAIIKQKSHVITLDIEEAHEAKYRVSRDKEKPKKVYVKIGRRGLPITVDGVKYKSVTDAANDLNRPYSTLLVEARKQRDTKIENASRNKTW